MPATPRALRRAAAHVRARVSPRHPRLAHHCRPRRHGRHHRRPCVRGPAVPIRGTDVVNANFVEHSGHIVERVNACKWPYTLAMARALVALAIVVLAGGVVGGDDWPAATIKEVFSESREWFVRVVPGKSLGDTFGFAGSPKGPYARAEFYQRAADRSYRLVTEITLDNPIAPVKFLVTDRGYLVTIDNWHNVGYGKMLVSYAPSGRRVASYELKDLFSRREIEAFSYSTSSIHWR